MTDLTKYIKDSLEPALFMRMDSAFPEYEFKRSKDGKKWKSPFHLDGTKSADNEGCYISEGRWSGRVADCNGSRSMSLFDFAAQSMNLRGELSGTDCAKVAEHFSQICGLSMPQVDSKEYESYRRRQAIYFSLSEAMQEALFAPEGAEALRYLKEGRGYSEALIREMGLGYLTEDIEKKMHGEFLLSDIPHKGKYYKVSAYYRLAIPYISRGSIRGFKFRTLGDCYFPDGAKVGKYHNTNGTGLKNELFGVSGARLSGVGSDRDIIIVEGELDALRAQADGLLYVVAATGGSVTTEALQHLRKIGADKVTLLFDTAERGSQDETDTPKKIENALRLIREAELSGYVARFPEREDGAKVDLDSFLREGHSKEEVQALSDNALSAVMWEFEQINIAACKRQEAAGGATAKNFEWFKQQTIRLYNFEYTTATEKRQMRNAFQDATGGAITENDLAEDAYRAQAENDRLTKEAKARELLSNSQELINAGKYDEALSLMKSGSGQLGSIDKQAEYARYLEDRTEALWAEYKVKPKGLKTGIMLRSGKDSYSLTLPSGAISIIGAATGHGKSRTLQSLALDAATNGEEGTVLYITYEENEKNVNRQLLNAYCNLDITQKIAHYGNERTLQEYLYNGNTQYIKGSLIPEFERRLSEYKELSKTALRIIKPDDNYLETLLGLLSYAVGSKSGIKVKAVFVDYVQELYIEGLKRNQSRPDELKEIMVELDLIAQKADIPLIMGAQLTRDTKSPLTMTNQDIADSAWIERKASEILLLWSSREKPKKDEKEEELGRIRRELPELHITEFGYLYAKLTKSRFVPKGADVVLSINGNTGRVDTHSAEEAEQSPLPLTEQYTTNMEDLF